MRMGLAVAAAAVVLLGGCGRGSDDSSGATASATSDAPVATTTTPAVPVVSEKTVCDLIFSTDEQPLGDAVDIVQAFAKDPDPSTLKTGEVREAKDSLESLASRSPESLRPHLQAQADTMQALLDAASDPVSGQSISFETFRSSGIEVANVCTPLL